MVRKGLLTIEGNRVSIGSGTEIRVWYCSGEVAAIMVDNLKDKIYAWPIGGHKFEYLGSIHEKFSLRKEDRK